MNKLELEIQRLKDNPKPEPDKVTEYSRLVKIIVNWLPRDLENNLSASEFIFYKPAYPYISETFWLLLKTMNDFGMKYHAYSSCVKDKDGDPVLFYKLIIPLTKGE